MTIKETQEKAVQLRRHIARLVSEFESDTGCRVGSIDLERAGTLQNPSALGAAMVDVTVWLPT